MRQGPRAFRRVYEEICSVFFLMVMATSAISEPKPYQESPIIYAGPYRATVVEVIDADTISVSINLWPESIQLAHIRVRNVDAPEVRTRCAAEKAFGLKAKAWVEKMYSVGDVVRIENVQTDPFHGRFVADIRRWVSDRWKYLEAELVERNYALPWQPGDDEIDWCNIATEKASLKN